MCVSQRRLCGRFPRATGAAAAHAERGVAGFAAIKSEGAGQGEADLRSAASRQHQQPVLHESSTQTSAHPRTNNTNTHTMATNRAAKSGFAAEAQRKVFFSAFLLIK